MSTSPYKKLKLANHEWIGYINISKLQKQKAYKILNIVATKHPEYGPGQQATVQGHDKKKWRTQLPRKYLAQLEPGEVDVFKKYIAKAEHPYLVFREVMMDNSYRLDIIEKTPEMDEKFALHDDIEELEVSVNENPEENPDEAMKMETQL